MRWETGQVRDRLRTGLRGAHLAFLFLIASLSDGFAQVELRTSGGEAWTFHKTIEGTVAPESCDDITITSPLARFRTIPEGARLVATVPLRQGDNRIEVECRKDGASVGNPAQQDWHVRLRNVPRARIETRVSGETLILDAQRSEPAPVGGDAIVRYEWRPRNAPLAGLPASGSRIVLPPPAADAEYLVTLTVTDGGGRQDESTAMFRVRHGRLEAIDPIREHSAWIDSAIIYGVVPPLFGPRGLADVLPHLDRLKELGITTLWLSPINASPPGDFGYAVTDYFKLRESIGGEADLRRLVEAAHARGLRVIMDFVPNHLSDQSAYFSDTAVRQRASPYFDFFARTATGDAVHYFDWHNLKNLNYDNPEVERLVIEAFAYWVREFDIDGFRVDVAWGPRQRAPDFWPRWRAELMRIKPDLFLLAEASARDPYFLQHGFDAAYDWTEKLGEWAWFNAFENRQEPARRLQKAIAASPGRHVVRFLENNDTGTRFATRYGFDQARVAAAMLLTLPGIPSLYTGQEIGAAYKPYEQPPPIIWEDPAGLHPWYARLIALRRALPALRSEAMQFMGVQPETQVLAYRRSAANSGTVLTLLNFGEEPVEVDLAPELPPSTSGPSFLDLLQGDQIILGPGRSAVRLPGHGVRLLKVE